MRRAIVLYRRIDRWKERYLGEVVSMTVIVLIILTIAFGLSNQ